MAHGQSHGVGEPANGGANYWRFLAMVAASTAAMFGLMYLNTYEPGHVTWSETRFWMAFVMGGAMMIIMLLFMWGMYRNRAKNLVVLVTGGIVFAGALWLVRSQATVDDEEYLSAMIPHHSIAILTSSRAEISDPRVRRLADAIIEAQVREIAAMKLLLEDIEANGEAGDGTPLPARTTRLTRPMLEDAREATVPPAR